MVGIAALTVAQQTRRQTIVTVLFQQGETRRLANRQTLARGIKGAADILGDQLQSVESVQGGQAQAVNPANHRRIAQSRPYGAVRTGEDLGAGGTGRRHSTAGALKAKRQAHKFRHRAGIVGALIAIPVG